MGTGQVARARMCKDGNRTLFTITFNEANTRKQTLSREPKSLRPGRRTYVHGVRFGRGGQRKSSVSGREPPRSPGHPSRACSAR